MKIEKEVSIPLGRAEDLSNQKFRHLTALYRVKNRMNRPTWQCQCDCGNYVIATAKELKKGSVTSCGCARNEGKILDHTGERHGKLVVLYQSPERASGNTIQWVCRCDCGNITTIRASNLQGSKSCGKCFQGKDLTNQRFGRLVAIKYLYTDKNSKKTIWECKCDCGGTTQVSAGDLVANKTRSCGCMKKSKGEEKIKELLRENNILFKTQKTFDNFIFKKTLNKGIFDFYVNNKYLIEYDGIQHFKPTGGWFDQAAVTENQMKDKEKNQWCKDNNIPLIRIPYTHLKDLCIEDLLLETSKFIVK